MGGGRRIETDKISLFASIGKGVYLAKNVEVRYGVKIDDYSYCSPGSIIFNNVTIGKYCSIGYNVQIGCPEHPTSFFSTSPNIYKNNNISRYIQWPKDDYLKPPKIGNDVWIGSNSIILQGVNIGDGAIIAAGAVVSKDVKPFTVVGGVPARFIRERFENNIKNVVSKSEWWNKGIDEIELFASSLYSERECR